VHAHGVRSSCTEQYIRPGIYQPGMVRLAIGQPVLALFGFVLCEVRFIEAAVRIMILAVF
jgi:hypothetical protein